MKTSTIALSIAGLALAGVGVAMAATNPNEAAYQEYATAQLTERLQESVCQDIGVEFLKQQCTNALKSGQAELKATIAQGTQRQNFVLFSLYKTDLSIPIPLVPKFRVETVGAVNSFHIYKVQKQ
jgi:Domain of unknown function (DUF4359)